MEEQYGKEGERYTEAEIGEAERELTPNLEAEGESELVAEDIGEVDFPSKKA